MEISGEPKFSVILAAAGKSSRFIRRGQDKPDVKKTFVHLNGKPLWLHSAEKFSQRDDVVQVIVAVSPEDMTWFRQMYVNDISRLLLIVAAGGNERVETVQKALEVVSAQADYVAVHDAARPCVTDEEVNAVFKKGIETGAALLAVQVFGTIKRVADGVVETTVDRRNMWEAQTPQVFRKDIIEQAHKQVWKILPTDDSELVERMGIPVSIVEGKRSNIKITNQGDLELAAWFTNKEENYV